MADSNQIDSTARTDLPGPIARAAAYLRRPTVIFWSVIIALLMVVQWPQLKAAYYTVTGAEMRADNIPWRTDYNAALDEAARSGKLVLLGFSADWCPPCKVMKHEVWPDEAVRQAVEAAYIPVYLDTDHPSAQRVAQHYGVRTIPAVFIVDANGAVLRQGDFMSRRGMLDFLQDG